MTFAWRYLFATIAVFYLAPGLRRIQDQYLGYSAFEIWSVLPLLMLIPFVYMVGMNARFRRTPPIFARIAFLWISGFGYALFLSFLQNNLFGGLLTFGQFVLPLGPAIWLATEELPASVVYERLLKFVSLMTTIVCVYGIIQWAVIPPWDAAWLKNIKATAFGDPIPFKLRAFSTLNAPGLFGNLIATIGILYLPRLTTKNWRFTAAFMVWMVAMGVTFVRASWLTFVLGAAIYFILTRRIQQLVSIVAVSTVLVIGISIIDPSNPVISSVGERFSSLNDVQGDLSFNQRSALYGEMVPMVLQGPVGMGLGMFGAGGRMAQGGMQIDSGILARLLEMGWVGCGLIIASLLLALNFCVRNLLDQPGWKGPTFDTFATLFAVQIALIFLETSGEAHFGILALMFWTTFGAMTLPVRRPMPTKSFHQHRSGSVVSGTM